MKDAHRSTLKRRGRSIDYSWFSISLLSPWVWDTPNCGVGQGCRNSNALPPPHGCAKCTCAPSPCNAPTAAVPAPASPPAPTQVPHQRGAITVANRSTSFADLDTFHQVTRRGRPDDHDRRRCRVLADLPRKVHRDTQRPGIPPRAAHRPWLNQRTRGVTVPIGHPDTEHLVRPGKPEPAPSRMSTSTTRSASAPSWPAPTRSPNSSTPVLPARRRRHLDPTMIQNDPTVRPPQAG